jgi:hypothetical protein
VKYLQENSKNSFYHKAAKKDKSQEKETNTVGVFLNAAMSQWRLLVFQKISMYNINLSVGILQHGDTL